MIELQNIQKSFGITIALQNFNLHIPGGQTTVFIGPSGCGKSTLLRIILSLEQPDAGRVLIGGEAIQKAAILQLRRRIGYVIQGGGLFPHLTARQNVCLLPRYLKWDRHRMKQRMAELANLTRFPISALDRYPAQLSGGQNQRVALMRALMPDPDLLLLDEPLGALDPLIRFTLQNDLKEIFAGLQKTVVLVTHDLAEADFFADQMVLMNRGRLVQSGLLRDFTTAPADPFVSEFIRAQRGLPDTSGEDRP